MSHLIDADVLIDEIKKDTEKAIEQDDRVGSFWLGYIAGLVIKQPTAQTSTSDLISRRAAIDALKNRWKKTRNYEGIGDDIAEECELYLKQVPPSQPEPQEGEWEQVSAQRYFMSASYFYRCSACGVNNVRNTNYCPNCGADMRGEKDERTD